MRTTLDIDVDVLEAAKELAKREHSMAGVVISRLARSALNARRDPARNGRAARVLRIQAVPEAR